MTSALLNLTQTAIWGALGNFSPLVIPVMAKVKIDYDYTITERNRSLSPGAVHDFFYSFVKTIEYDEWLSFYIYT